MCLKEQPSQIAVQKKAYNHCHQRTDATLLTFPRNTIKGTLCARGKRGGCFHFQSLCASIAPDGLSSVTPPPTRQSGRSGQLRSPLMTYLRQTVLVYSWKRVTS